MNSRRVGVIHTQTVVYEVNGIRHEGYLAVDRDIPRKRPGVLVAHEAMGLSDHAREKANRLAKLGYVAFAVDYIGGGRSLAGDKVMEFLGALMADPLRIRALGRAGLEVLKAQPEVDTARVAAIGYCFGGTLALELARGGEDLAAVVGFHSGLSTARPEDASAIRGSVLVCIGADDPYVPPEQRTAFESEMRGGNVDWRLYVYGGVVHSFTNEQASAAGSPALAYHAATDARTWRAMLDLFEERLGAV
jgi:dienelactone hydrolase